MEIKFGCTYWGSNDLPPHAFLEKALAAGYTGVELFLQPPDPLSEAFMPVLDRAKEQAPGFFFIAMQITLPKVATVQEHIAEMLENYRSLQRLKPDFINAHTGRDYFSFDDNCRIIEAAMDFGSKAGIRIVHETHRGRFSFHAAGLLPYLRRFPELELAGDLSHFCTVSESMLDEQQDILSELFPFITHIHARVGHEQGPQVNDPAAPEWQAHVQRFLSWWGQIASVRKQRGQKTLTITPEFGPAPYMPAAPFTCLPLSSQWENNLHMMRLLRYGLKY